MTFHIGDRVTLLRTGATGSIAQQLPDGNFQVRLDGGLGYLPAPGHALALQEGESTAPAPRAKEEKGQTSETGGVQLAFDPLFNEDGEPSRYQLYLINGTSERILYEIKVRTAEKQHLSKFGPLAAGEKLRLNTIAYGWLNERLQVDLDVRAALSDGTGPRHFQQVKIRPKQFFGSFRHVPALNHGAHQFVVFARLRERPEEATAGPTSTLREITRAQRKPAASKPAPAPRRPSLADHSDFNPVLDLHLESLVPDPKAVPRDKILGLQMERFDAFIDQALRLDVERVIIVHGLGNGILKTEIHQKLQHVPFVRKFTNDYHPQYGYGATEVFFDS